MVQPNDNGLGYRDEKSLFTIREELIQCAGGHHLSVAEPIYHVMIPVYGDYIAEIHLPIAKCAVQFWS